MIDKIKAISKHYLVDDQILLNIYAQVQNTGILTSQDMRWITSIGIPGFTILAQILAVPKSDIHIMCYDGKITLKHFEQLINLTIIN